MARDSVSTVVVGAGPAGLAVGACLRRAGVRFVMLEKDEQVGASWRRMYERLRLHTVKRYSALPYLRFPSSVPRYPTRQQMIDYLEAYARHFALEPRFGREVRRIEPLDGGWEVETGDERLEAKHVVLATGLSRVPHVPAWPGLDRYAGRLLHSARYSSGTPFSGMSALVVGCGNSGAEIALDLDEHGADVTLSVRGGVHVVPREFLGVPIQVAVMGTVGLSLELADRLARRIARAVFGDLGRYGLAPGPGGAASDVLARGRFPVIDVGTVRRVKEGRIRVAPGIDRFEEADVVFRDGSRARFDVVILATGFRPRLDEVLRDPSVLDERGQPKEAPVAGRGLYFVGFRSVPTGILREIGREARRVARAVVESSRRTGKVV